MIMLILTRKRREAIHGVGKRLLQIRFPDSFLKAFNAHDAEPDAAVRIVGEHQALQEQ
jgi:hypothetical protein